MPYNNNEVAKRFAQGSSSRAENHTGSLYFTGDTIYSYGTHFPIARKLASHSRRVVLWNPESYSKTTSAHQNTVRGALRKADYKFAVAPVFYYATDTVKQCNRAHRTNLRYHRDQIYKLINKQSRARKRSKFNYIKKQYEKYAQYIRLTRCGQVLTKGDYKLFSTGDDVLELARQFDLTPRQIASIRMERLFRAVRRQYRKTNGIRCYDTYRMLS
jgi:hypothetical protein